MDTELCEKVARTLARQNADQGPNGLGIAFGDYWEIVLTERVRDEYRARAAEILAVVGDHNQTGTQS